MWRVCVCIRKAGREMTIVNLMSLRQFLEVCSGHGTFDAEHLMQTHSTVHVTTDGLEKNAQNVS